MVTLRLRHGRKKHYCIENEFFSYYLKYRQQGANDWEVVRVSDSFRNFYDNILKLRMADHCIKYPHILSDNHQYVAYYKYL